MKNLSAFLVGGLIGFLAVLYFIIYPEPWSIRSAAVVIISLFASIFLGILLHELGHFIAGRGQGMQLLNLSVGPFVIERHKRKLYFHFVPSVLGYLGRAMMVFPEQYDKHIMRKKLIRYVYGGPITNIVLGALSLALAFFTWHEPFFLIFGLLNILLGTMNLKPAMASSVMTDGLVLQKLKTEQDTVMLTGYAMATKSLQVEDVKEWSPAFIQKLELLVQSDDPMSKIYLQTIGYYYFPNEASRVTALAQPVIDNLAVNKPDYYADMAGITFATALLFEGKLTSYPGAEALLQSISKVDKVIDFKRQALQLYRQGDLDGAIGKLHDAHHALGKWHPLYLRGEMEKRLLLNLIKMLENRPNEATYFN